MFHFPFSSKTYKFDEVKWGELYRLLPEVNIRYKDSSFHLKNINMEVMELKGCVCVCARALSMASVCMTHHLNAAGQG